MNASDPQSELNVAVIGFGKLGLLHAGIVGGLSGSRFAAFADPSSVVRDIAKQRMPDVRFYSDHEALLADGSIDAAFITSPTGLHVPIALACVDAGVPVFIEKPLALNANQARPLCQALERRPVVNMVGYMGRYLETFRKAKKIISTGALGRLQMVRASMYIGQLFKPGKGWRYDKEKSGGGVLITQNAHLIDKLIWFFGDIDWVSGHANSLYSKVVEDHVHAYFSFASGLVGSLDASWSARHYRTPTIAIHMQGAEGTLDVDDDEVRLFLDSPAGEFPAGWSCWRKPDLYEGVSFDIGGPHYTRQTQDFLAAVRGGDRVGSDVASAYKVQCVIDAVYRSALQDGAPVHLAEVMGPP